jgi:hypothetical protein
VDLHEPLDHAYDSVSGIVGWFHLVPVIVGVLLAAPLISDLEQRTVRLAWTQSVTRRHWLALKLGVALLAIVLFSVVFTALMTWWYAPLDRSQMLLKNDVGESFDFEGVMPFCYALFAFGLALASGVLSRRVLAAPLVAFVGFVVTLVTVQRIFQDNGAENAVATKPGRLIIEPPVALRDMQHFWTMQGIEAAIFISAALVLVAVSVWLVQRRA